MYLGKSEKQINLQYNYYAAKTISLDSVCFLDAKNAYDLM